MGLDAGSTGRFGGMVVEVRCPLDRRESGLVLRIALRDLQWRRRRFAFAALGVALVFGLTLVITGVSAGFFSEADNTVSELGASEWVVHQGADGPFLGSSPFPAQTVNRVSGLPGVRRAVPTVYTHRDVVRGDTVDSVNVYGAPTGNLGMPTPSAGRQPTRSDEIMISTKLKGYPIGSTLELAGHAFKVVGQVDDSTALAGTPNVFLTLTRRPASCVRRVARRLRHRAQGHTSSLAARARCGVECRCRG